MIPGTCDHCQATGQHYAEWDRRARHFAIACFTCGAVRSYVGPGGQTVPARRSPSERERSQAQLSLYSRLDRWLDGILDLGRSA